MIDERDRQLRARLMRAWEENAQQMIELVRDTSLTRASVQSSAAQAKLAAWLMVGMGLAFGAGFTALAEDIREQAHVDRAARAVEWHESRDAMLRAMRLNLERVETLAKRGCPKAEPGPPKRRTLRRWH